MDEDAAKARFSNCPITNQQYLNGTFCHFLLCTQFQDVLLSKIEQAVQIVAKFDIGMPHHRYVC